MIGAVVVRQHGSDQPAPARPEAPGQRMRHQLTRSGAQHCIVTRPGGAQALSDLADLLASAGTDVLIAAGDVVVHDEALADLVLDPRQRTAVLLAHSGGDVDTRVRAGRVVDASCARHRAADPDAAFTGVLLVAAADTADAAAAAREMAEVARGSDVSADATDLLLVALVRHGVAVGAVLLDPWPWSRGTDDATAAALRERLELVDVERMRLARAGKTDDGPWATLAIRPLSRRLTPVAVRRGWSPNQITLASFVLGLAAAGLFALGDRYVGVAGVLGALLLQLSLVVDCVDGDVARYTRSFSPLGAWLDASTDRVKEFACYAGLAVGAGGGTAVWLLAAAMLALQTTRHSADYTFTAVKDLRDDGSGAGRAVRASERSNARPGVRWVKKLLHLPIGERWLVLSLGGALAQPRAALAVLLTLGLLSLAYTATGRTLRTRSWPMARSSPRELEMVTGQLDPGPLALVVGRWLPPPSRPPSGRFLWAVPPVLRLVELATIVVVTDAVAPDAMGAAFALLLCIAYHHYDTLYAVLNRLDPAPLRQVGLGVDGRVLVVSCLAVLGSAALFAGLWAAAGALAVLFLGYGSLRVWREVMSPVRRPGPEVAGG